MIVIATPSRLKRCAVTAEHHERFLEMMPQICRQAQVACRGLGPEAQQDFVQSVVAAAFVAFARLVELGKEDIVYATPLAQFAIRHVRCGRNVGSKLNVQDVSSRHAQLVQGIHVQRLDRRYADGMWKEVLVEDHRTGPAETAAARIDISSWLRSLPLRDRRIAKALANGDATSDVAEKYQLSSGRISQLRNELRFSWLSFQGELPQVLARRLRSVSTRRGTLECGGSQPTV